MPFATPRTATGPHCLSCIGARHGLPVVLACLLIVSLAGAAAADEWGRWRAARATIRASQLQAHVDVLASDAMEGREAGQRGGRAAGDYLARQLQQILAPAGGQIHVQPFGAGYRNLLGVLEGQDPQRKSEYVLIGAHYDHVGYGTPQDSMGPTGQVHNGADDNASGTAAVLEVLAAFARSGYRPARSVLFAFWDGEEKGLLGAQHWAQQPTVALTQVRLALNLDMVGRVRDERVEVYGTRSMAGLRSLVSRANRDVGLQLDFVWKLEPNGDHHVFFSRQIPVVMFHTGLHDQFHRPSDDAALINAAGLEAVAQLAFSTITEAADGPVNGFRALAWQEGTVARQIFERPLPPPAARLGISWSATPVASGGLRVTSVRSGSPAAQAGIQTGDVLLRFGEQPVVDSAALQQAIVLAPPDVRFTLQREGQAEPLTLSVRLNGQPVRLGFSWRENSAEPETVTVVRVVPHSPAAQAGLSVVDRIQRIGGQVFANQQDFAALAHTLPLPLELLIERRGQLQTITLPAARSTARQ